MIKSTIASFPNQLSVFKAPKYICEKMDQAIKGFWWGHDPGEIKLQLKNWNDIRKSKSKRGLGIRKIEDMNKTLLGKQAWRIISKSRTLMVSTILPKYCK